MNKFTFLGVLLILSGIIFSLNSIPTITGFAVMEGIPPKTSSILGFLLILTGVIILNVGAIRARDSSLATIVADHQVAHDSANFERLRKHYQEQQRYRGEEPSKHSMNFLEHKYGLPPGHNQKDEWIVFYHASPNGNFKLKSGNLLDSKSIKGRGFYMADNPLAAQEEIRSLHPSDISIHKIKIAKSVIGDLKIEQGVNDLGHFYRLRKDQVKTFNDLFKAGYIILEKGR